MVVSHICVVFFFELARMHLVAVKVNIDWYLESEIRKSMDSIIASYLSISNFVNKPFQ